MKKEERRRRNHRTKI